MSLITHARKEATLLMKYCDDDAKAMQEEMNNEVLNLIQMFASQGHTGSTGNYALHMFTRLVNFKPLTPLTGEDDEWIDVMTYEGTPYMQQNLRCSSVFRELHDNCTAYMIDAKIFTNDNGVTWFTNANSKEHIDFPFAVPSESTKCYLPREEDLECESSS